MHINKIITKNVAFSKVSPLSEKAEYHTNNKKNKGKILIKKNLEFFFLILKYLELILFHSTKHKYKIIDITDKNTIWL